MRVPSKTNSRPLLHDGWSRNSTPTRRAHDGGVTLSSDPLAQIEAGPGGPEVGAFFDLDGTLIAGFTATAHASDRLRTGKARIGEVLGVIEASVRYKLGRMQFERLLVRAATYLRDESLTELSAVADRVYTEHVAHKVYPLMREIVSAHQKRGHTVVLSSSALTIHAEPVARALGITDVVCNTFELGANGLLTGRVNTPIVWGRQKAAAVQRLCAERGVELTRSYFYADGNEDAALMKLVGNPRPVNPRPGLAALAQTNDWPVLQVAVSGHSGPANALGHLPGLAKAAGGAAVRAVARRGKPAPPRTDQGW